jgi:hypothetical protein
MAHPGTSPRFTTRRGFVLSPPSATFAQPDRVTLRRAATYVFQHPPRRGFVLTPAIRTFPLLITAAVQDLSQIWPNPAALRTAPHILPQGWWRQANSLSAPFKPSSGTAPGTTARSEKRQPESSTQREQRVMSPNFPPTRTTSDVPEFPSSQKKTPRKSRVPVITPAPPQNPGSTASRH